MTGRSIPLVVALVACSCLLLGVALVPAAGASPAVSLDNHTNDSDDPVHEDPEEVDEDGDEGALADFLERRLGDRLNDHAIAVSEGEYERAQELLGEDYQGDLGRFAELEDDLGSDDDSEDSTSETVQEVTDQQEEYSDLLSEYEQLREEYEQARAEGDQQRARELARELIELSERLTDLGVELETTYERLDERSTVDFDPARHSIGNTTQRVDNETETIRLQEFEPAVLTVELSDDSASFDDPVTVTATVTDENGTAVEDGAVGIVEPGGRSVSSPVENGTATLEYAPVTQPVNREQIPVLYRPDRTSIFLGNSTTADLSIEQVEASLLVSGIPETVTFGDTIAVTATVEADGTPVESLPIQGTFGGGVNDSSTDGSGAVGLSWEVGASAPGGEQPIVVTGPEDQAVTVGTRTTWTVVESTATELSVSATPTTESGVEADDASETTSSTVDVTLETVAGDPVSGEPVQLRVDGEPVGTVRTGSDGTATTSVPLPEDSGNTTISATYEPEGGSLAGSSAETSVLRVASDRGPLETILSLPNTVFMAAGGGLVVLVAAGYLLVGRRSTVDDDAGGPADSPEPTPSTVDNSDQIHPARSRLDAATDQLESGTPDTATVLAYTAAREAVTEQSDLDDGQTHWAFYRDCANDGLDAPTVETIETLTEQYELAAFAPESVDRTTAADAVDDASDLVEGSVS